MSICMRLRAAKNKWTGSRIGPDVTKTASGKREIKIKEVLEAPMDRNHGSVVTVGVGVISKREILEGMRRWWQRWVGCALGRGKGKVESSQKSREKGPKCTAGVAFVLNVGAEGREGLYMGVEIGGEKTKAKGAFSHQDGVDEVSWNRNESMKTKCFQRFALGWNRSCSHSTFCGIEAAYAVSPTLKWVDSQVIGKLDGRKTGTNDENEGDLEQYLRACADKVYRMEYKLKTKWDLSLVGKIGRSCRIGDLYLLAGVDVRKLKYEVNGGTAVQGLPEDCNAAGRVILNEYGDGVGSFTEFVPASFSYATQNKTTCGFVLGCGWTRWISDRWSIGAEFRHVWFKEKKFNHQIDDNTKAVFKTKNRELQWSFGLAYHF